MKQQQTTTKGFAILGITNIICKILAIIYLPIQTMILGISGNGIVSSGYIAFLFIYSLTNAGLNISISKLVAEQDEVGNYRGSLRILRNAFIVLMFLGIFFAVILIVFSHAIAAFFGNSGAYLMLIMIAPTFIFTSVSCALRGFYQGRRNMMPTAISQIIEQLLNTSLTVLFASLLIRYGVIYGAAGTTIGTSIGALGAAIFLVYIFKSTSKQRKYEIKNSPYNGPELSDKTIFKEIMKYSFPALLSTVAFSASSIIDGNTCISRLEVFYIYKNANHLWSIYSNQYQRMFTLAVAFVTAISTAIIPAISAARVTNDIKTLRSKIKDCYKAIFFITIPSIAGLTFLAKPILTLVFFSFNQGSEYIIFGTWTAIFLVIMNVQMAILIGIGKPLIAPINLILGMFIKFVLNYALIAQPNINIYGAIVGTFVGWIITCLLNQFVINLNITKRVPYMHMLILPSVVSIVMGIGALIIYNICNAFLLLFIHSTIFCNDISVIIAIVGAACIYGALMIMLRGINTKDILRLPMGSKLFKIIGKVPFLKKELDGQRA
jgi:stage V sporulation protein B